MFRHKNPITKANLIKLTALEIYYKLEIDLSLEIVAIVLELLIVNCTYSSNYNTGTDYLC